MSSDKKVNQAVVRSHKLVAILASEFFIGAANKDLAAALETSAVNVCRDLDTLKALGFVEKQENGKWRLTVKALRPLRAYQAHYEELSISMADSNRQIGF